MVFVFFFFFLRTLFLFLSGAERDTHKRNNSISFQLSKPMSLSRLFSGSWVRIYLQGQQHHQKAHLTVTENSQKLQHWSSVCRRRQLHCWVLSVRYLFHGFCNLRLRASWVLDISRASWLLSASCAFDKSPFFFQGGLLHLRGNGYTKDSSVVNNTWTNKGLTALSHGNGVGYSNYSGLQY